MSHGYLEKFLQRQSEAAIGSVLLNNVFFKISLISQKDSCVGVPF